jgi:hypothetical protein
LKGRGHWLRPFSFQKVAPLGHGCIFAAFAQFAAVEFFEFFTETGSKV